MKALNSIEQQLQARFAVAGERGRVVLWTDPKGEYANQALLLCLPAVTVLPVENNEFAIKRRVFDTDPQGKYLIYRGYLAPEPAKNWLLDIDLAYQPFTTDSVSLVVQSLGSKAALRPVVEDCPDFFADPKLVDALRERLSDSDDETRVRAKATAVVVGSADHTIEAIWRELLKEYSRGKSAKIDALSRLGLAGFHWVGTRDIYGYRAEMPTVEDFVIWLFTLEWNSFASAEPGGYRNIQRDASVWANDQRFGVIYRRLAEQVAADLDIAGKAANLELADLAGKFTFREVEESILTRLAADVERRTILDADVQALVAKRSVGPWFADFESHYRALGAASDLLTRIGALHTGMHSPADGVAKYAEEWFRIDQAYRQFVWNRERAGCFEPLRAKVEGCYTTDYLKPLGDAWQRQVETLSEWRIPGGEFDAADTFFDKRVSRAFLSKNAKVVVVISDGLRFEVAEELARRIESEDRYTTTLTPMLGMLPSYTQLGMAALLPHDELSFSGEKDRVSIDGKPTHATELRSAFLAPHGGQAIQASKFMRLDRESAREVIKAGPVLYLYHNKVDSAGDDINTEHDVFKACEEAIVDLVALLKKLAAANVNNVLITADHGFLYQTRPLADSEYLSEKPHGAAILREAHRFVLGRDLKRTAAFNTFTSRELGLVGDIEAQVPKSIHRIRTPGGGVRYVHGGASLQEIVVPVLAVNKARATDTRKVGVRIMVDSDRITTTHATVMFYQSEPVTEKVQARTIIAAFYGDDTLISNEVTVPLTSTAAGQRERYLPANFVLSSEADAFNGQDIELRLYEIVGTSGRNRLPETARYRLNRVFTADFGTDF